MSFYDAIRVGASGAAGAFEVQRSLRFDDGSSHYLTRTPSSVGNKKTFTFSFWVKRANLGITTTIFAMRIDAANQFAIRFISGSDILQIIDIQSSTVHISLDSSAVFRDVSAWYHIVVAVDTTQSTNTDRFKLYVNGSQVTSFSTSTYPSQNHDTLVNTTNAHYIGKRPLPGNEQFFDGYLAEFNFIDGSALTPSSFGETNAETGQWMPIDTGNLTFGTNGFTLNFSDNSSTTASTLGKDTSGNGNNFTPNNFGATAHDQLKDTPTNNFAVLNALSKSSGITLGEGNLYAQGSSAWRTVVGNFHMSSGKWYWEIHIKQVGNSIYGILPATRANGRQDFYADIYTGSYSDEWGYSAGGTLYNSASGTSNWGSTYTAGDILGFALDMDNGTLDIKKNGSTTGSQITGISTTKEYRAAFTYYTSGTQSNINFGQDSTFAGEKTAQGNTDGNGQGDFYYAPPSGYKALCSANLPDPTILLPNNHFDTLLYSGNGSDNRDITGLNFAPDWLWIKRRDGSMSHNLGDTVRGANKIVFSDQTAGENTETDRIKAYNSDGFRLGTDSAVNFNGYTYVAWNWNAGDTDGKTYTVKVVSDSGNKYRFNDYGTSAVTLDLAEGGTYTFDGSDSSMSGHPFVIGTAANGSVYSTGVTYQLDGASVTYSAYTSGYSSATTRKLIITVPASAPVLYYWCSIHSGMGGQINTNTTLGSSNFGGTIQSTVKANTTAGFSIATWVSDGSGSPTSFGHGLGVRPDFVIIKNRSSSGNWQVWSSTFSNATNNFISLNLNTGTQTAGAAMWGTIDSTVVNFRHSANSSNGNNMVGYFFSSVAGYSKFGKYTGNGSADGTFVSTSFKPAWVMIKRASGDQNWRLFDNKRNPFNDVDLNLQANTNDLEFESSAYNALNFLSNGFKLVGTNADEGTNQNGQTYIYLCFAEAPFKNSRAR